MNGKLLSSNQMSVRPLDGERKIVTVMFADIVQSSRLIAGRDPEDADDHLFAALQVMIEAVQRFGGTVNQVLGDGIMAVFGAPRAQEDHALRACLAAGAVHRMAREIQGNAGPSADFAVRVRIGLSSGEVVIKTAENETDRKYRVIGEAVYLAQRLEDAAPTGVTLLSRATLNLAAGQVRATHCCTVSLERDSDPVNAYELIETVLNQRSFKRLSREALTSFTGRTSDLDALQGFLDEVEAGQGRAVVITGDAGIGKSRLLYEFLVRVRRKNHQIVTCDLLPTGLVRPLEPAARILRSLMPARLGDSAREVAAAADEFLRPLQIDRQQALAAIFEVLGLTNDESTWAGLDPPQRLQAAVETVSEIIAAASRRKPLVLVFEDFQWAGSTTRLLADDVAARVSSSRVLMIVTCRTHYDRAWAAWPQKFERNLQPLTRSQTSALLEDLLGPEPTLEELRQLLAEKTQGNPFFLEECVRSLAESGGLTGAPGGYQPAVPIANLEVPDSVHAVLAARIDSLSEAEKTILLCASVIGPRFDVGLLRSLCLLAREELLGHLSRLQDAGFVDRTRVMPNLEFSFRHALIHDVAYGMLLKRRRRELHGLVTATIERRSSARLPNKVDLLAHHAFHAENWPRALVYCRRAGLSAQGRSANREAVEFLKTALQAAGHCGRTRRYREREIDIRLELVQSLFTLGQHDQVFRELVAAEKLASYMGDERRVGRIKSALVLNHWVRGDLDEAVREGRQALAVAERLNDLYCQMQVATRLGGVSMNHGDYGAACQLFEATVEKISSATSFSRFGLLTAAAASNRAYWACALGELGRFEDAIKVGDESIRIAEQSGHAFSQIHANVFVGNALLRKGDFERSLPPLLRSFELCETTRARLLFPLSAASLGYAYVRMGDVPRGLALLESAATNAERHTIEFQLSQELAWLGEAYLLAGDDERALKRARGALEHAERHGAKGDEAWALWLFGQIYSRQVRTRGDQAEECLQNAQEIAFARHMRPLLAHIDLELGQLYAKRLAWVEANLRLDSAASAYRSLGMAYWHRIADAALADISRHVPHQLAVN